MLLACLKAHRKTRTPESTNNFFENITSRTGNASPDARPCEKQPRTQRHGETRCPEDIGFPCLEKCFFKTEDGLLGLCPTGAREGDLIVVLYSGSVSCILRETVKISADSITQVLYKFVEECYVQEEWMKVQ
jgi:hypothetical protein